jgi:hypothetical protein
MWHNATKPLKVFHFQAFAVVVDLCSYFLKKPGSKDLRKLFMGQNMEK